LPAKISLLRWLAAPSPSRQDIRRNRDAIYNDLNRLMAEQKES
jgi:hypothetical protein